MFENFNFLLWVKTQSTGGIQQVKTNFLLLSHYISLNCFDANMYATKENGFIN